MRDLSCRIQDLVPWLGIEPTPPALAAQSLNHWITREVPWMVLSRQVTWSALRIPAAEWGRGEAGGALQGPKGLRKRSMGQPLAVAVVGLGATADNLLSPCSVIYSKFHSPSILETSRASCGGSGERWWLGPRRWPWKYFFLLDYKLQEGSELSLLCNLCIPSF